MPGVLHEHETRPSLELSLTELEDEEEKLPIMISSCYDSRSRLLLAQAPLTQMYFPRIPHVLCLSSLKVSVHEKSKVARNVTYQK